MTPIQVVGLATSDEQTIEVGFSHPIRNLDKLEITLTHEGSPLEYTLESKSGRDLCETWLVKLKEKLPTRVVMSMK